MIEPEVAFLELPGLLELAEEFVSYVVGRCLDRCREELKFLERDASKLENVAAPFPRITYDEAARILTSPESQTKMKEAGAPLFASGNDFGGFDETVLTQGFERPVMVTHWPAVIKAFFARERPGARPLHELLHARRGFERVAAAVNVVDRLLPGTADRVARRLASAAPLALAATRAHVVDFGSGGTVFRLETPAGPRALKVFRRSLGRPLAEQRAVAAYYADRYRTVSGWYAGVPGLVVRSAFLILPGPIHGRPVAAAVQPFLEGPRRCFFEDLDAAEARDLLRRDPCVSQQFRGFAAATLESWKKGERCLDLVGRENLMLLEQAGRLRLAIADCGLFELAAVRRRAPERYASLAERIRRVETLVAELASGV